MQLTALNMTNFRGVRDPTFFDLDAAAVLLWGPNGTGKTSFFDAILWLFRGDIPRLARLTLRRNEDYVANAYSRGEPAVVTATFRVDGRTLQVRRQGNSRDNVLEVLDGDSRESGEAAEATLQRRLLRGRLPLTEVLHTSGLLQQDDLRLLFRDKPDQRYRQLLRLLGLEVLEQFERQVRESVQTSRTASRNALRTLEEQRRRAASLLERIETLRLHAEQSTTRSVSTTNLDAAFAAHQGVIERRGTSTSPEDLAALSAEASTLIRRTADVRRRIDALVTRFPDELDDSGPLRLHEELRTQRDAAVSLVSSAQDGLDEASRTHDALNTLAAIAIPLLRAEQPNVDELVPCPVCSTRIDAAAVITELTSRARSGSVLAAAEEALSRARAREGDVRRRLGEVEALLSAVHEARRTRLQAMAEAADVQAALTTLQSTDRLRLPLVTAFPDQQAAQLFNTLSSSRARLLDTLQQADSALRAIGAAADVTLAAAQAARNSAEETAQLPRLAAQLDAVDAAVAEQQVAYDAARRRETVAGALASSANLAIEELFRERFSALEPLMNDIYGRLDPHPAFTKLDFRIETYRARGTATATVTDERESVEADPMLVFSSAQANLVVLSAFLALGWAAGGSGLPFVLMDDPLQALDDVNVLGFADLMRQFRRRRQVVVATHEERFARVLERKLAGRHRGEDLLVHQFLGWDRNGPTFATRRYEAVEDPALAVLAS